MAIYTCELKDEQDTKGVVLIDSCGGLPLPIQPARFADADDAQAFLDWMDPTDVRQLTAEALDAAVLDYRGSATFRAYLSGDWAPRRSPKRRSAGDEL